MRKRLRRSEVLALMALAGMTVSQAQATNADSTTNNRDPLLKAIEQPTTQLGSGKDSACGKGSCGTDDAGAKAAQEKHKADAKKAGNGSKSEKTKAKKTDKKESGQ